MMMECSELSEDLISIINKYVRFEEYKERIGSKFTCRKLTQRNKSNKKNKIIRSLKSDLLISLHGLTELEKNMLKDNVLNKESVFEEWQFQGFNLLVKLHRPLLYSKLFEQLLNTKMYVFSECCKRIALSKNNLNICQKNNLNHLRQSFFYDCIVNLLQFCGYEIFLHQTSTSEEEDLSLGNHLLNKAKQLVSTKGSLNISNETLINDSSDLIAVNCFNKTENNCVNVSDVNDAFTLEVNKIISSEKFSRDGYDSNINVIPVLYSNNEWSSVFKNVVFLESSIRKNFSLDLDVYVYVLLEKELFCTQQTILLWKTIGDYSPNNVVHCVVGNTLVEDGVKEFTADEFYSSVYNMVKTSSSHKKENSAEDLEWKVKADLITDACLKFKFLSSCIWSSVRINSETLHNDCVKPGSFIMYNYSRLSSILNRYERNVKAGIYPELPSVAEIDVSLLYRDDEWNLLVHYVAAFPCLIEEIIASIVNSDRISSKVPIHKLYLFLLNLSHEVSSYYCAVHILVEPVPHLMQLMFSRLLLIKSVHQVMRNVFTILDIKPVEQILITIAEISLNNDLKRNNLHNDDFKWRNSKLVYGFRNYYIIKPSIMVEGNRSKYNINTLTQDGHLKGFTLEFEAFSKTYLLNLQMNKDLLPYHFMEKYYKDGVGVINKPYEKKIDHCFYNGKLQGISNSWVAISTCDSISGVIFDGTEMLFLEPMKENDTIFIYRELDLINHNFSCGYKDFPKSHLRIPREAKIRGSLNNNRPPRYVELVLVNDVQVYKTMNEDKDAVIARSKIIANIINALYRSLNISIALVGVEVWSEFDQIIVSENGDNTLINFLHYRQKHLALTIPNDNAQLITGVQFAGGIISKALKGPICTHEYSGGVNTDHSNLASLIATTIAHSLGHNFGMEHDTDDCTCQDDRCIMAPRLGSVLPTHWSSCSLQYLHFAFEHGMDYCLFNKPTHVMGPVCGNGFVEEGEQCDCGLESFCNNPCCDAKTCFLFPNATCATGECCDIATCQLKSSGTACRPVESECDLPEFCDGKEEYCPDDVFKQNGVSCKQEKAYCYQGSCHTHSDQCKLLWGHTGQISNSLCFNQNTKGNRLGNCGYFRLNQTYKPCEIEDVLCGLLHCVHLNERLEFGMESLAILSRSFINSGGKILVCRSAIVDLGLNSIDPGLVPDGAKCGDDKVCVNQTCMPVSAVRTKNCPYDCNKQGICNSKGNCHCNRGFAPPYCDIPGLGGSVDSGPISDPKNYFDCKPVSPITVYSSVGKAVKLSCENNNESNSDYIWYFRGRRIKTEINNYTLEHEESNILEINIQNNTSFGIYMCRSSNGLNETYFNLINKEEDWISFFADLTLELFH